MNHKVKKIIQNLIKGLIITILIGIAFQLYYGNIYTEYILLIGFICTIIISKAFLLPFANYKFVGKVVKSRVRTYVSGGKYAGTRFYRSEKKLKIKVKVKTRCGYVWRIFEYDGDEDDIPVGTKIRFTLFDDRPEII